MAYTPKPKKEDVNAESRSVAPIDAESRSPTSA